MRRPECPGELQIHEIAEYSVNAPQSIAMPWLSRAPDLGGRPGGNDLTDGAHLPVPMAWKPRRLRECGAIPSVLASLQALIVNGAAEKVQ